MNRLILASALCAGLLLCGCKSPVKTVAITNPNDYECVEVVELDAERVSGLMDAMPYAVVNPKGEIVQSQVTHDGKLVFLASVPGGGTAKYGLRVLNDGQKAAAKDTVAKACGKVYPQRDDDIAWENDKVAFRAYGPNIQRKGEKMYGYDLFLKRDTAGPVLEGWYAQQCSGENWRKVNALRKDGKNEEADIFVNSFTYHVDHGNGMDCYAVGPTLGAGATALLSESGEAVFPWCYDTAEILDNGPVRFTARLTYKPVVIDGDTVVEQRLITLDLGSHLNRTEVSYQGLSKEHGIVTGLALRDDEAANRAGGTQERYIAYIDPTQGTDNGKAYVGAVFPFEPAKVETAVAEGGYPMHLMAQSTYKPGQQYVYYWGNGWNRSDMPDFGAWTEYLGRRAAGSGLSVSF